MACGKPKTATTTCTKKSRKPRPAPQLPRRKNAPEQRQNQSQINDFLTLSDIPPETFAYKLGNRSALDWVIDQYRVKTDKRSGMINDPNNLDDETYILRLIKQVITVSLETVEIVNNLPPLNIQDLTGLET